MAYFNMNDEKPKKSGDDLEAIRVRVQELLKDAEFYEGQANALGKPYVPSVATPDYRDDNSAQGEGSTPWGDLYKAGRMIDPLKLQEIPYRTGKDIPQTQYTPNEDPRRAEYLDYARKARANADKLSKQYGLGDLSIAGSQPDIKDSVGPASVETSVPSQKQQNQVLGSPVDTLDTHYRDGGANSGDLGQDIFKFSKLMMRGLEDRVGSVPVALMSMLAAMGPEAQKKYITEFASGLREMEQAHQQRTQMDKAMGADEVKASGEQVDAASAATEKSRMELKALFRQLNETPEMHSNISVLALILMSFIMGPKLAAALFVRKSQNGTLKYEIQSMMQEVKSREMEQRQAQRDYDRSKRDVAQRRAMMAMAGQRSALRMGEAAEKRGWAMEDYAERLDMRTQARLQELLAKQRIAMENPTKDRILELSNQEFNRLMSQAKSLALNGQEDEANAVIDRANSVHEDIMNRRKQLRLTIESGQAETAAGK